MKKTRTDRRDYSQPQQQVSVSANGISLPKIGSALNQGSLTPAKGGVMTLRNKEHNQTMVSPYGNAISK